MNETALRKLTDADRARVFGYIQKEPEINLFLFGDVELFGLEGPTVEAFARETAGGWDFLVLRYLDNFMLYSQSERYDAKSAADFLSARAFCNLSGKCSLLERLLPFFPERYGQPTYMARLDAVRSLPPEPENFTLRRLSPGDAEELVGFYQKISEFRSTYAGRKEKAVEEKRLSLSAGGRCWGAFRNGRLVAAAGSAAENSVSAMVVGVATLPAFRRKGLAGNLTGRLCRELLDSGRQFVCLFYDNPQAGSIYRRIGFGEVGRYMMIKRRTGQPNTPCA